MADEAQIIYPTPNSATVRPANRLVRRLVASVIIAIGVIVADQVTKWLAESYLTRLPDQSISIIGDFLRLTYVANRGAAFGILQNQTIVFVIIGIGVIAIIVASYRYFPVNGLLLNLALGLQLGGAVGNLIDRVGHGYVVDFIDVALRRAGMGGVPLEWPVFNLADSSIVIGVGILAFHLMRTPERTPTDTRTRPVGAISRDAETR
jgi:signal peptidase II